MNPVVFSDLMDPGSREVLGAILDALGEWIEVDDGLMNWSVGLTGAAMRTVLPVLEGQVRAADEAGFAHREARRMAARVLQGTAALISDTTLSFDAIKSLTPMETLNETALSQMIFEAVLAAKRKIDHLET
jgi:pyrroline-5-carboxylate reductase